MRPAVVLVFATVVAGCGPEEGRGGGGAAGEGGGGGMADCPPGEPCENPDGPSPDWACVPGSLPMPDGSCLPAGIPEGGCATGFVHDGARSCEAILPSAPCPPGEMAVPGDATCRPVGECGTGTWGNIPVEAGTVYVDGSYASGGSNGSEQQPFTTIQAAVNAASEGDQIAVAAGSYDESFTLQKAVRIWGRCPSMVAMSASGGDTAPIVVGGVDGVEVRGMALTSDRLCAVVAKSVDVLFDEVWMHDCPWGGLLLQVDFGQGDPPAPTEATIANALIEDLGGPGAAYAGASLIVDRTHIRNVASSSAFPEGSGIYNESGDVAVTGSLIENAPIGLHISGGQATIEASVVRDGYDEGPARPGLGLLAESLGGAMSVVNVADSLFLRNRFFNLAITSSMLLAEGLIVAETLLGAQPAGRGIHLEDNAGMPSLLELRESVVRDSIESGIFVGSSDALIESTYVRGVAPMPEEPLWTGYGVTVGQFPADGALATATVAGSLVEQTHTIGIGAFAAEVNVSQTAVRDASGPGILYQQSRESLVASSGSITDVWIDGAASAGLSVGSSSVDIHRVLVNDVVPYLDSDGDGIAIISWTTPASATIGEAYVIDNRRAGIASFGASIDIGGASLRCNPVQLNEEVFGLEELTFEPVIIDAGGNSCGCDDSEETCKILSTGLTPPTPIGG